MVSAELSYTADNSTMDEAVIESSLNSSMHDQNTSDAEVETISDTAYQKNEASAILQASQTESDNKAEEEENAEEGAKSTTVLDIVDYAGNDTSQFQTSLVTRKVFSQAPKKRAHNRICARRIALWL